MWCLHLQEREIIEHHNHIKVYWVHFRLPYLYTLDLTKILIIDALTEFYVKKGWIKKLHCWQIFS
jgi:hypothetical protein